MTTSTIPNREGDLGPQVGRTSGGGRATEAAKLSRKEGWSRRAPLLPALLFMIVVTQLPFIITLFNSFRRWILVRPNERGFVGVSNYQAVFTDPDFWHAVWITLVLTVSAVLISLILGLVVALLLDRKFIGRGAARTLLITPFLVMPAAGALVWKTMMLNPDFGIVDWILRPFGGGSIDWAGRHPLLTIVVVLVWQWMPFMMLILLAGLQGQSPDIIEAAQVDGAGAFAIFQWMTLPHLRQYMELCAVLGSIYIIQTFDQVYLLTQGGPGQATTNLPYFIYLKTFRAGNIGYSSAAGVIVVIGTIILATFALRLVASMFREEGSAR